jgi:hypothetical protein
LFTAAIGFLLIIWLSISAGKGRQLKKLRADVVAAQNAAKKVLLASLMVLD